MNCEKEDTFIKLAKENKQGGKIEGIEADDTGRKLNYDIASCQTISEFEEQKQQISIIKKRSQK